MNELLSSPGLRPGYGHGPAACFLHSKSLYLVLVLPGRPSSVASQRQEELIMVAAEAAEAAVNVSTQCGGPGGMGGGLLWGGRD